MAKSWFADQALRQYSIPLSGEYGVAEATMSALTAGRWGRYISKQRIKWVATIPASVLVIAVGSVTLSAGELHDAVLSNDTAALEALLDGGAAIDETDYLLGTALHRAAVGDNAESARILIAHGADVEAVSEQQDSRPLHLAADAGSIKVLALLVQAGADIEATDGLDRRPLGRAAAAGQTEAVEALLNSGAGIEARGGQSHRTPLIEAAYNGRLDVARFLVQRGADVNARDDRGKSALWMASTPESYVPAGGPQLIEFLAENGADVEAADNTGMTPLAWAKISTGRAETYKEIAEVLIALGARH